MWHKGKTNIQFDTNYKNFPYKKNDIDIIQKEHWQKLGYNHKSFNGEMFNDLEKIPNWCYDVAVDIGLKKPGFTFYKMVTNDIMPLHKDHFSKYCQVFDVPIEKVYRAAVFLEDWKSGHYFEIEGQAVVNWNCGDYVLWSYNAEHAASNIGIEDRYTLQVTGQL